MTESTRLSKRVVELARCSRSEAERYIEDGWVRVDGVVVELPQFPIVEQKVELDPSATLAPKEPATLLFHKPAGMTELAALALVTKETRWADDTSGVRHLGRHLSHLAPVLPLEPFSSGLCIFTQDARVARRLLDDVGRIEQELIAEVEGKIMHGGLERLGFCLDHAGRALPPIKVSWQNEDRLRFPAKAPQPGQIALMCEQVGLKLLSLKRIRVGAVPLKKMPVGTWRHLPVSERF